MKSVGDVPPVLPVTYCSTWGLSTTCDVSIRVYTFEKLSVSIPCYNHFTLFGSHRSTPPRLIHRDERVIAHTVVMDVPIVTVETVHQFLKRVDPSGVRAFHFRSL
jgi:hypothetical protein